MSSLFHYFWLKAGQAVDTSDLAGGTINGGQFALGIPVVTQMHKTTGVVLAGDPPTLSSPNLSAFAALSGVDVLSSPLQMGIPAVVECHTFDGVTLSGGEADLADAGFSQTYAIASTTLSASAIEIDQATVYDPLGSAIPTLPLLGPVVSLESGTLTQLHELFSLQAAASAPTLDSPAMSQHHVLISESLTGSPAVLEQSSQSVALILESVTCSASPAVLEQPALTQSEFPVLFPPEYVVCIYITRCTKIVIYRSHCDED